MVLLAILSRAVVGRAAGSARIVLRVSNWGSPAVESGFMTLEREIREEFEQMHPGVRVQFEQIPGFGQYAPKLLMMHVSGSVPDVIALDASSAAVFIDNGVVRDLAPLVAEDPEFRLADYFERVVQIFRRDQRVYSIPL
ncbi:MAG TPA: extracellular solute-binding protein, partial [Phycisphaerae bacterium]|nr:extracellular solute-binding protein [Phycisphaerae bacterium]